MATTPTSMVNRLMGLEAFTDPLSLPAGTTVGGATIDSANRVVAATGATLTVTAALHANKIITLSRASGIAVTLPNATGTGNSYTFFNITALSAASHVISRGTPLDVMAGLALLWKAAATNTAAFVTAANSNVITLNATTTGGLGVGDWIRLFDLATNLWFVELVLYGSGTLATPFSNA